MLCQSCLVSHYTYISHIFFTATIYRNQTIGPDSRGGQENASCDVSTSNQRVTRSQSRGDSAQSAVEPSREDNTQDDDSVMSNTDEYATDDSVKYVLL